MDINKTAFIRLSLLSIKRIYDYGNRIFPAENKDRFSKNKHIHAYIFDSGFPGFYDISSSNMRIRSECSVHKMARNPPDMAFSEAEIANYFEKIRQKAGFYTGHL